MAILLFSRNEEAIKSFSKAAEDLKMEIKIFGEFNAGKPPEEIEAPACIIGDLEWDEGKIFDVYEAVVRAGKRKKFDPLFLAFGKAIGDDSEKQKLFDLNVRNVFLPPFNQTYLERSIRFWTNPRPENFELLTTNKESFPAECEMSIHCKITQLSEFGANVRTNKTFEKNEMVWVQLPEAKDTPEFAEPLLARVYVSAEIKTDQGLEYNVGLVFLGIPDQTLKAVRRWIRLEYAKSKHMD